jgi:amino-acid N-acetyltransferase
MNNLSTAFYNPPADLPRLRVSPDTATAIRRARVDDVQRLYELISYYAARDVMLHRPLDTLYNKVREFYVVEAEGEVVGCAALRIVWRDLAEVVSLVVHPDFHGHNLGRKLVAALFTEARELAIPTVCTLTLQPGFFSRLGFRELPKVHLHHKLWQDCDFCPKKERCDEVPMIRETTPL